MSRFFFAALLFLTYGFVPVAPVRGEIVEFSLTDGAGGLAFFNEFTNTLSGLSAGGVQFDASITVRTSGNVALNGSGMGVNGSDADINLNDMLQFAVEVVQGSEVGGAVTFDGFTGMTFSSYTPGIDSAGISSVGVAPGDIATNLPNNPTFGTPLGNGISLVGESGTTDFRISSIFASFTGTAAAVPEPSSMMLMGLGGLVLLRRRR